MALGHLSYWVPLVVMILRSLHDVKSRMAIITATISTLPMRKTPGVKHTLARQLAKLSKCRITSDRWKLRPLKPETCLVDLIFICSPELRRRSVHVNNQLFQAWPAHLVGDSLYARNLQALLLVGGLRHIFDLITILELSLEAIFFLAGLRLPRPSWVKSRVVGSVDPISECMILRSLNDPLSHLSWSIDSSLQTGPTPPVCPSHSSASLELLGPWECEGIVLYPFPFTILIAMFSSMGFPPLAMSNSSMLR
jgi:hypothetical protein